MRAQRRGHLLPISSIGGVGAFPNTGLYHATKWGLEGLSESLAQEVEPFGIHVTIVEPGPFRTDWNGGSMVRATPMHAYDDVLGPRRRGDGRLVGVHPARRPPPCGRGHDPRRRRRGPAPASAARRVRRGPRPEALAQRIDEAGAWRDVAVGADFPEGER